MLRRSVISLTLPPALVRPAAFGARAEFEMVYA